MNNPECARKTVHQGSHRVTYVSVSIIVAISQVILLGFSKSITAQIIPDNTLGNESSVVTPETIKGIDSERISGGAVRGSNLFHRFQEFNIVERRGGYFENPAVIQNIFSRVTGSNPSEILGTLGVLGNANLFFLNPNGIIFGQNASLDLRGSFLATTADSIVFPDGNKFSALNPDVPALLIINRQQPIGLEFEGREGIITNAADLSVNPGQTLALVGGNVVLDGGSLTAPGGRIELGGVAEVGTVEIKDNKSLNFSESLARADLLLTNGAKVEVAAGGGGTIAIAVGNVEILEDSSLVAGIEKDLGSVETQAGDLIINATGEIRVEQSRIQNDVMSKGIGNSGNIHITAESLSLTEEAELTANTFGVGNAGNIFLRINGPVTIVNGSLILSEVGVAQRGKVRARGKGGLIDIEAESFSLIDDGRTTVRTRADGDAGKIIIRVADAVRLINGGRITSGVNSEAVGEGGNIEILQARSLSAINGGFLQSSTSGVGNAGDITVNASDFVELSGTNQRKGNNQGRSSGLFASTEEAKPGNGGEIGVTTDSLRVSNGAVISVISNSDCLPCKGGKIFVNADTLEVIDGGQLLSAALSQGNAGNIIINDADQILISGSDPTFADRLAKFPKRTSNIDAASGLFARTESSGTAGSISISTQQLNVSNQTEISASTSGTGGAGSISIVGTDLVNLDNSSIFTTVNAGAVVDAAAEPSNINIQTSDLSLTNNSQVSASTAGIGNGGQINLEARETISIENSAVSSAVEQGAIGNAGNVSLTAPSIAVIENSTLSTATDSKGNAGEIKIIADEDIVFNNSNASSAIQKEGEGKAGTITVKAKNFEASNGSQLRTATANRFDAGDITLEIEDNILLDGNESGIFASTEKDSTGRGGSILTQSFTPKRIIVEKGAAIAVNSEGTGTGGNITLIAEELLLNKGSITAATASNQGGDIILTFLEPLRLRNNSQITATAGTAEAGGDGGNINIDAPFIIAVPNEDSDITANAFEGNGGKIIINTEGIFGIEFRDHETPLSDITASSEFGQEGEVEINTNGVDPTRSLNNLPQESTETEVAQSCQENNRTITLEFFDIGRGGLPPTPDDLLSNEMIIAEWIPLDLQTEIELSLGLTEKEISKINMFNTFPCQ